MAHTRNENAATQRKNALHHAIQSISESRDTEHFRFYYNKSTFAKVTLQIFYNNSFSPKQRRALFNKFTFDKAAPRTFLINSFSPRENAP